MKIYFLRKLRNLALWSSVFACCPAFAQTSTADLVNDLTNHLNSARTTWAADSFQTTVTGANPQRLNVGSEVWFNFRTDNNCHVTMVMIDSEASVTIARIFDQEVLAASNRYRQFPAEETFQSFQITPPTGLDHFYTFCTSDYLNLPEMDFVDAVSQFRGRDTKLAISLLLQEISSRNLSFSRNYWTHRVVARDDQAQYSAEDVIEYFKEPRTRGFKTRGGAFGDRQQSTVEDQPIVPPKRLPLEITFNFGSAELTQSAQRTLDEIGYGLQSNALFDRRYRLGGHTDSIGSEEYNLELSRMRAETAKNYLQVVHKIDPSRLEVIAYGELFPKTDNQSVEGRRNNRRVELESLY